MKVQNLVKMVGELQKEFGVCPYHFIRTMFHKYDVVLMPYQCLLNQRMRTQLGIKVEGNIIVLDEAHNVEDVAEQEESFDIEHYKIPKGLMKKLGLEKNPKNSMVGYKAVEKLVKLNKEIGKKKYRSFYADEKEYRSFQKDLQTRLIRIFGSKN